MSDEEFTAWWKPGEVHIEPVESVLFVMKSDVEIGEFVWHREKQIYALILMEGYVEPNITTTVYLHEHLLEAQNILRDVIDKIDDPSLRTDAFGNIH